MVKKSNHKVAESNRLEVLLEAIQEDFKIFGESLDLVNRKVDVLNGKVDGGFEIINKKLLSIESKLDNKVDQEKFHILESRVRILEKVVFKK